MVASVPRAALPLPQHSDGDQPSRLPPRFPELESPGLSKILRSAAFVYPFLFDNLPLFYRVRLLLSCPDPHSAQYRPLEP